MSQNKMKAEEGKDRWENSFSELQNTQEGVIVHETELNQGIIKDNQNQAIIK